MQREAFLFDKEKDERAGPEDLSILEAPLKEPGKSQGSCHSRTALPLQKEDQGGISRKTRTSVLLSSWLDMAIKFSIALAAILGGEDAAESALSYNFFRKATQ
jgi:hypothetical protein